jgi:hypothetical protein
LPCTAWAPFCCHARRAVASQTLQQLTRASLTLNKNTFVYLTTLEMLQYRNKCVPRGWQISLDTIYQNGGKYNKQP